MCWDPKPAPEWWEARRKGRSSKAKKQAAMEDKKSKGAMEVKKLKGDVMRRQPSESLGAGGSADDTNRDNSVPILPTKRLREKTTV